MPVSSKLFIFFLLFFINYNATATVKNGSQNDIVKVISSDWRPYVYQENNQFKGSSYDILTQVFNQANLQFDLKIMPWARVYSYGLTKKNQLILGLGRTPQRENLFHWIGPVDKGVKAYFFRLKTNAINITKLDDVKNYRVGIQRRSYNHEFMIAHSFEKNLQLTVTPVQLIKMLIKNRLDLVLIPEKEMSEIIKNRQLDPNLVEKVFFAFKVVDYMAFSKTTSQTLIRKVTTAYQALNFEGKINLH